MKSHLGGRDYPRLESETLSTKIGLSFDTLIGLSSLPGELLIFSAVKMIGSVRGTLEASSDLIEGGSNQFNSSV